MFCQLFNLQQFRTVCFVAQLEHCFQASHRHILFTFEMFEKDKNNEKRGREWPNLQEAVLKFVGEF